MFIKLAIKLNNISKINNYTDFKSAFKEFY